MTTSASIDHIGIGVPDLAAAKKYHDELVAIVGFREWFPADEHQFNYGPDGTLGTQIFFYRALEPDDYSRHGIGLQHLAFSFPTRAVVEQAYQRAVRRGSEVVHQPRAFPE
jgi:catechol 2,3-dioxygenase-like lactoylglutathione lyase family enzyme